MKIMRLFALLFALTALGFGSTACDDKDGGDSAPLSADEQLLVGKWLLTRAQGSVTYPNNPGMNDAWDEDVTLEGNTTTFKANRTFEAMSHDPDTGESERIKGTWSITDGKLIPRELDGTLMNDVAGTIKSLTEKELVLEERETLTGKDGEYEEVMIGTFTRQE